MSEWAEYLILSLKWSRGSEDLVWYKPEACGYTTDLNKAGRFTLDEAKQRSNGCEGDVAPVRMDRAYLLGKTYILVEASLKNIERLCEGHAVDLPSRG